MRIAIAALAAALVAALAVTADAAPSSKKKQKYTTKERQDSSARQRSPRFGYDASPDHYRVGTSQWWQAMEREGRAGFGDTQ